MQTTILGYPRIGARRELKRALEHYWAGRSGEPELLSSAAALRREHWQAQAAAGLDSVPVNDFSLYDHVLDACCAFGVVPERFREEQGLTRYFLMARGRAPGSARELAPLEMTKWFDTNYHYLVPEIDRDTRFAYQRGQAARDLQEAQALGLRARPVLLGPVSFLQLAKNPERGTPPLERLDALVDAFAHALADLHALGATWVQLDEPCLALDWAPEVDAALARAYERLAGAGPKLLLATYFGRLGPYFERVASLPLAGVHVDALNAEDEARALAERLDRTQTLSLGLVDGRSIWRSNLRRALEIGKRVIRGLAPERVQVAPSSSLLHVPVDLTLEQRLDPELRNYLSFARQKLDELVWICRGLCAGRALVAGPLEASDAALRARAQSLRLRSEEVRTRLSRVTPRDLERDLPSAARRGCQRRALGLPLLPTTTIGSFPQTEPLRRARAEWRKGALDSDAYQAGLRRAIDDAIALQERLGLDVLVHGEAERNDMVEYFAAALDGVLVTEHGWVQSYGSRCVKPPIVFGDVARPRPISVELARYAQSRTRRPLKGMLTGPVTLLKWSFVRDDQPLEHTCRALALALRDEVLELEAAGIRVIQVDEPAFREALPLRRAEQAEYLRWAVECFRLATSGVRAETQIHTHMCYSEFGDMLDAIAALDADVISIESARSAMDLLRAFSEQRYDNEIGLGIYDIHSPRVPDVAEMRALLEQALTVLDPEKVWVNPDCGLKTRAWAEVVPALENMVAAARAARAALSAARNDDALRTAR